VVTSTETSQRAVAHALLVEIPTMAMASSPDLSVGEGDLHVELDTAAGANARILDPKAARILLEAVAATWEVHQLWEVLLPTVAQVPVYS
jgi:hypothetical protein